MSLEKAVLNWAKDSALAVDVQGVRSAIEAYGWPDNDEGKSQAVRFFTFAADALPRVAPMARQEPTTAPTRRPGTITPEEWLRARVVSDALVRRALADPKVIAYRERYRLTGGWPEMHPEEAVGKFLDSLRGPRRAKAEAELDQLCSHLHKRFGFSEPMSWSVVITGENRYSKSPIRALVELDSDSDEYRSATITLQVAYWVSPDTVRNVYADAQQKLRRQNHRTTGRPALETADRAEKLRGSPGAHPPRLQWQEIVRKLGLHCTWRNLRRDVERTMKHLLLPRLYPPKRRK